MRLLVVTKGLPPVATGGAEAHAYETSAALSDRHEVRVLSGTATHADAPFGLGLLPLLPPLPTDAPPYRKIVWHGRDQWRPEVARRLSRQIRGFGPDVVVTHNVQGLSAGVFTALARMGVSHVHIAHDFNVLCVRASMTKDLRPCSTREIDCLLQRRIRGGAVKRRLDLLVAPSEFVRQRHVTLGIVPHDRAVVLRHGARPAAVRVRRRDQGPLHLGYIGALTGYKGVPTLLRSLEVAPPDWRLAIAGKGPLEATVRQAAASDPRITYVGHVSKRRKDEFFHALDLLIVPSEWEENAPLVLMEASVRGLPAVVSDRGGLPEHPAARVFPAGDPAALREAIRWFDEAPERLTERSRELIEGRDRYSWDRHVERLEALLRGVVEGRLTPAARSEEVDA